MNRSPWQVSPDELFALRGHGGARFTGEVPRISESPALAGRASSVAKSDFGCRRDLRARHRVGHWSPVKPVELGPNSAGGDTRRDRHRATRRGDRPSRRFRKGATPGTSASRCTVARKSAASTMPDSMAATSFASLRRARALYVVPSEQSGARSARMHFRHASAPDASGARGTRVSVLGGA